MGGCTDVVEHVGVEGVAEPVGGEDVETAVADVGGGADIESRICCTVARTRSWDGTPPRRPARGGGADEVEQVGPFGFVELQRPHDAFEDVLGHAVGVAPLEAGVVLDADPRQHGDLFAAQPLDPPVVPVDGEAGVGGRDLGSARRQELADVLRRVHAVDHTTTSPIEGVPASTPHDRASLTSRDGGWVERTARRDLATRSHLMRAAIFNGPGSITVGTRPDPIIKEPTDAVVRVVMGCVCGSDLWYYRGESDHAVGSIGHEFIGVVEDVGDDVTAVAAG